MVHTLGLLLGEQIEKEIQKAIGEGMREALASGASQKRVARAGLQAILHAASPVFVAAQALPGFTIPLFMTSLASKLERSGFLDNILPGDDRFREAKVLLREAAKGLTIGTGKGLGEALSKVDESLDRIRSDETVSEGDQKEKLDWVAVSCELPGRIFPVARDSAGEVRRENGRLVILHPDWVAAKAIWDRSHKATTRTIHGGKNQPPRTEQVQAEPFPEQLLPLPDALAQMGGNISPQDFAVLQNLLKRSPEWWESIGGDVRRFFLMIGRSIRQGSPLDYTLREDIIKDVVERASATMLQDLAAFYNPRAVSGRFGENDLEDILASFDALLGAELTPWNRMQRGAARAWRNRKRLPKSAKAWVWTSFLGFVAVNIACIMLFLGSFLAIVVGALMPYTSIEDAWFAAGLLGVGGAVIVVLLFTLRIWQKVLHPMVSRMFQVSADFLSEFGWRFSFMLMPIFLFVIGAILLQTSVTARVVILALAFVSVSIGMGYKAADAPAKARLLTLWGAQYGWLSMLAIMGMDYVIRTGWHERLWVWGSQARTSLWQFLFDHPFVYSVLLFFLTFLPLLWAMKRTARRQGLLEGQPVIIQGAYGWRAFLAFLAALLIAVSVPWFKPGAPKIDPFALFQAKGASSAKADAASEPPPTPSAPAKKASAPRHAPELPHSGALDCAELSFEGRRAAGCP
ncbi:hypothetical protein FJZ23_01635 [Candidatus Parcubacteria bacterium]|nr:hypothetical protein [Candidatus Parcubacteria bacterium]